jgi:hypothetical protein
MNAWYVVNNYTSTALTANASILEINTTISGNVTISTGKNALSVGPITVLNGVNVTVPAGTRWVVI